MNAPDVKLTVGLLVEIAKNSFRGFKRAFKAQHDPAVKQRPEDNGQATRMLNRCRIVRT